MSDADWQPHESPGRTAYVVEIERQLAEARAEVERLRQRAEAAEAQLKAWQEDWREGRRELLAWAKEEP